MPTINLEINEKELIEWRHILHQNPEIGFQEYQTTDFIISMLKKFGITDFLSLKHTGVVATIHGEKPGPCLAFRADIDALPMSENSGYYWSSRNEGVCHACGHDVHATVLLGLADVVQKNRGKISGTIRLLFQPAEESLGGALSLIKAGALENPEPIGIVGLHVWPETPVGSVAFFHGPMMAAADSFKIIVKGKQGHGAHPHHCIDSIMIAGQIINGIQTIVSREKPPLNPGVISLGSIHGGEAPNIIPERIIMEGTLRALNQEMRDFLKRSLERIVRLTAEAHQGEASFEIMLGYPPLIPNEELLCAVENSARLALGKENVLALDSPSMGGEDFSFYTQIIPGAFFRLGTRIEEDSRTHNVLHSPYLLIPDEAILPGVKVLSQFAIDQLVKN